MLNAELIQPLKFVLVVGNARSGTTIIGSIIDSHPRMICANETSASLTLWRGLSGRQIIEEIVANSRANLTAGRPSEGYSYGIATADKDSKAVAAVGDKIWNPALLFMAGSANLLGSLETELGCPIFLVHCVRNPFDVIATMHSRSGASLRDRMRWYAMHCEAIQMIVERGTVPVRLVRNEDLIAKPNDTASRLFEWLGHPADEDHLRRIRDRIFQEPSNSRQKAEWPQDLVWEVDRLIDRFPFLSGYAFEGSGFRLNPPRQ